MGCAASSPLARALNPVRLINQAREAKESQGGQAGAAKEDTPYPLHGELLVAAGAD